VRAFTGSQRPAMEIELRVDPRQMAELERLLIDTPKEMMPILRRQVTRAGKTALTIAKRAIAREIGLKQKDLVSRHRFGARGSESTGRALRLDIREAPQMPYAVLRISGKRIPVVWFKAKQKFRSRRTAAARKLGPRARQRVRAGVSWKIGRRGRVTEKMAFFGRGRRGGRQMDKIIPHLGVRELGTSGHRGVFRRAGRTRLPIYELRGPSIPYIAERNVAMQQALDTDVSAVFAKRIDSEIDRLLKKRRS